MWLTDRAMNLNPIQRELRAARLDGWLSFDHHERDPLAHRLLGLKPIGLVSRRWYYCSDRGMEYSLPGARWPWGEPGALVHRVEPHVLDALPGANANAADSHYGPPETGSAPIRRGDLALLDLWAKLNNEPEARSLIPDRRRA